MRFVELRPDPSWEPLRLHPRLTWLRGLDPATRVAVVGMIHDVALGDLPDWDGLVEMNGETVSLAAAVEAMGETSDSGLVIDAASLPEPACCRIRCRDQRRCHSGGGARQAGRPRRADRRPGRGARGEREGPLRHEGRAGFGAGPRRRGIHLPTRPGRRRAEVRGRAADRPDPWTGMSDVPGRMAELGALLESLDTSLAALPSGDRPALAAAAATARAALGKGPVVNPEAAALAHAWLSLHQRLRGLESRVEAAGRGTEDVAARGCGARRSPSRRGRGVAEGDPTR
ncbi:MAG: hypothetical protein R2695_15820 [Acidimicrobiales bacterium]